MTARMLLGALVLTTALAGFLVGASTVSGSELAEPMPSPATASGTRTPHPLRGSFWRPAGSDAERPAVRLQRVAWTPPESKAPHSEPDALASMWAVVRLASTD